MPDDETLNPPETPPGAPDTETPPEKPPVAAAPSFTKEDVGNIVRGVITELSPKAPAVDTEMPAGPDPAALQAKITELDAQIDQAVQSGTSISALQRKRDELRDQHFEAVHVAPLRSQGSQAINDVVLQQIAVDADLGDLFKEYRSEIMTVLAPAMKQGQALRLDWVKEATSMVIGRHQKEIRARDKEAFTRASKETPTPLPGANNGRTLRTPAADRQPETIKEAFGDRAAEAFEQKRRKGHTEDTFARSLGYADKTDWIKQDRELSANQTLGLDK